ncbi:hypothetical protein [Scytonema sp. PCC 10023]
MLASLRTLTQNRHRWKFKAVVEAIALEQSRRSPSMYYIICTD